MLSDGIGKISSGIFLMNKRLQDHMPQITWSAISVAFMMLPLALQDVLWETSIEVCIFQRRELRSYEMILQSKQEMFSKGHLPTIGYYVLLPPWQVAQISSSSAS